MKMRLLRTAVRLAFICTPRRLASRAARRAAAQTLDVIRTAGPPDSARSVRVPPMAGVDEDMRAWSLFMILEHNTIVNHAITHVVKRLAAGQAPVIAFDMKKDVMPSPGAGIEQVDGFQASVDAYLAMVRTLPRLRGTPVHPHPLFGPLDAHGWHCMFAFHLMVHRRQAAAAGEILRKPPQA